jgi:hypothetical protein
MSDRQEDDRLERSVGEGGRQAEEGATAEILALEQGLDRVREQAARALEEVERRLDEAEARGVSRGSGDPRDRAREDARRSERERELLEQSRAELEARIRQ